MSEPKEIPRLEVSSPPPSTQSTKRRRPIPRKGHTKSRAGCPNCKRRKVKCDEVSPVCGPCKRLDLNCEYVKICMAPRNASQEVVLAASSVPQTLSTHPGSINFTDLRFFQHFLISAFPPLPVGGRHVWQYISQMSHKYEFLVHSMLGLGASHLSLLAPGDFNHAALQHRVAAIEKLNRFLSIPKLSVPDTEAAFAAILALTFQAAHMPDGLDDFLTMTRGCFLVGTYIVPDLDNSAFKTFERDLYIEKASAVAALDENRLPLLDEIVADGFRASLEELGPLCNSVVEIEHLAMMRKVITSATNSLYECFREHSFLHEKAGRLSAQEFALFTNPNNHIGRLVIIHMLLMDCIMSRTICVWEEGPQVTFNDTRHRYDARNVMAIKWIENIYESLPEMYQPYAQWPLLFARYLKTTFQADTSFWKTSPTERGLSPEVLQLEGSECGIANSIIL
ncbi:hypothetical protein QQS21_008236 [Conoideocrella luteorostrata]|uniref:Zn(2)-C6 fungal-type domain-containing protein n=1 Tax=Conoideocrella luteorostrata TaxID=1105319 RepID=A0AAJ0CNM1_9HYPO|nr:hypothetical protein QQS21_008236 [Conoideocrella luteorostrata]